MSDRLIVLEEEPVASQPATFEGLTVLETADTAPVNPVVAIAAGSMQPAGGQPAGGRRRPLRGAGLAAWALLCGLLGLCGLLAYLWVAELVQHQPAAGMLAAIFLALLLAGVLGLAGGEIRALSRLAGVREDRDRLMAPGIDRRELTRTLNHLAASLTRVPALAPGVLRWREGFRADHPPVEMLGLFDAMVLTPADRAALALARRTVRLTFGLIAISPTALSDTMLFWFRALRLVRQTAEIYGYRPGRTTTLLLASRALKDVGLIAGADFAADAVGHFLGGKMLERVSTAAAEGAIGAYRMGRFALLVMEACRPLPFPPAQRPKLLDLLPGP